MRLSTTLFSLSMVILARWPLPSARWGPKPRPDHIRVHDDEHAEEEDNNDNHVPQPVPTFHFAPKDLDSILSLAAIPNLLSRIMSEPELLSVAGRFWRSLGPAKLLHQLVFRS